MSNSDRATLRSVAERVGVSAATVSRVLSGQSEKYRISKKTSEKVVRTAIEIGYVPDEVARSLRTQRTNTVGLIIPDISNPFFSTVAHNVEIQAKRAGTSIILSDSQEDTQYEIESIRLLQSRKVDGILLCPVGESSEHILPIVQHGPPIVLIDRNFPELKCSYVISDNYRGSFEAVKYLVDKNHRHIAFIQGRLNTFVNDERVRGYMDAHKLSGLKLDESYLVGDSFGKRNGYIGAKILLKREPRPTAIFCGSNLISLGAMSAIMEEGLRIPEDVSLISFDDQPYSDYLATPMTTVDQQTSEIGQIAFKLLLSQIKQKGKTGAEGIVLPTKLILRKSVSELPTSSK